MQGKLFFIEIVFVGHENDRFFPIQILIFGMLRNIAEVRRYSYLILGLPVLTVAYVLLEVKVKARPSWSVAVIRAGIHVQPVYCLGWCTT